jgi:hypothetical protein
MRSAATNTRPPDILKYEGPNDLDRMMNEPAAAWARVGAGKGKEAISRSTR